VNRYMLVGQKHSHLFEYISKLKFKTVVCGTVLFSLLINVGQIFLFRINYGLGLVWDEYSFYHYTVDPDYPSLVAENSALGVYKLIFFIVNFVIFLIVNTFVEYCLVNKIHKELADKKAKTEEEIRVSNSHVTTRLSIVDKLNVAKQQKIEKDAKKETRAIEMVIGNSLVNFFLRLPEIFVFISSSHSLFPHNELYIFFRSIVNLESMLVSIAYWTYTLTFITNVVIYCLFNEKFKHFFAFWPDKVKINK
jgi:hypothetical protein